MYFRHALFNCSMFCFVMLVPSICSLSMRRFRQLSFQYFSTKCDETKISMRRFRQLSFQYFSTKCDETKRGFAGYTQPETKQDALQRAQSFNHNFPCIILVNPSLDQNIGSVARCMLNYGFTELRIVNPSCEVKTEMSYALAAGAYDVIENCRIVSTLEEAIDDLTTVMATSDRIRHMAQIVYTPDKAAETIFDQASRFPSKMGIMFGRERSGLSNDEMAMANAMIAIPTFSHFSSLNLAQAVNIVGYEIWKEHCRRTQTLPPGEWLHPVNCDRLATTKEMNVFFDRLEKCLDENEFQTDEAKRKICYRNLRNIFQRNKLTKNESGMLHGVLSSLMRSRQPPS